MATAPPATTPPWRVRGSWTVSYTHLDVYKRQVSHFRRMMTIEQFRSPELSALYSRRYVERMVASHAGIFRSLIASGELRAEDPDTMAMMYICLLYTSRCV